MNKWAMMYGNNEDRYGMRESEMEGRRYRGEDGRYTDRPGMRMDDRYERDDRYDRYDRYSRYDRHEPEDRGREMRSSLIGFEREKEAGLIGPDNRYNMIRDGKVIPMQDKKHGHEQEAEQLDKHTAKQWVEEMKGAPFSEDEAWHYAEKMGLDDEEIFPSFWAAMNAVYTDYKRVAKEFHVDKAEFYAALAKAFICDEDAVENKVKVYYEHIVEHK